MKNILEFFEKTTIQYPEKTGFCDLQRSATFLEVQQKAKKIATLLAQCGTKRAAAILIDKSVSCIEAMLGSLYAGDYYTVIDVHSPIDRIKSITPFRLLQPRAM